MSGLSARPQSQSVENADQHDERARLIFADSERADEDQAREEHGRRAADGLHLEEQELVEPLLYGMDFQVVQRRTHRL